MIQAMILVINCIGNEKYLPLSNSKITIKMKNIIILIFLVESALLLHETSCSFVNLIY